MQSATLERPSKKIRPLTLFLVKWKGPWLRHETPVVAADGTDAIERVDRWAWKTLKSCNPDGMKTFIVISVNVAFEQMVIGPDGEEGEYLP